MDQSMKPPMTDTKQTGKVQTLEADPASASQLFWVDRGDHLIACTAEELLEDFEKGAINGDTAIRIKKDAPNRPLRSYLRELVWIAYRSQSGESSDQAFPSLFKVAFERAPLGIVLSDLAGRIEFANAEFCRMLGYSRDELAGMRVGTLSDAGQREEEIRLGNEVISGKRQSFQMEKRFVRKDGQTLDTLLSVSAVADAGGKPTRVVAHVVDLTQRKLLERKLAGAVGLQTTGRLAAGVAHDFNNLLTVILGLLPGLEQSEATPRGIAIDQVREAAEAGARLTRQLMTFARQGVVEVCNIDLNAQLEVLRPVLKAAAGHNAELKYQLTVDSTEILADRVQLEQVVMNLSFNALSAMPDGGVLTIRTERTRDGLVILEVEDTGVGMSEEVRARAFEPFYTTDPANERTGLGLSTVYGIVTRFGGQVTLVSTPGAGTLCRTQWPKAKPSVAKEHLRSASTKSQAPSESRRILVVDDQPTLLSVLSRALRRAGYQVVEAESVRQGSDRLKDSEEPFDVLVCDVMLQDGNGGEVAAVARRICPSTQVLFISGYSADHLSQSDVRTGKINFLQKPFRPRQLLERVASLIEIQDQRK